MSKYLLFISSIMIFCYIMYIMNIVGIGVRILWKLKPKMIESGLSYEMRVIRSVNRLHVNNLGPSGIRGNPLKFW